MRICSLYIGIFILCCAHANAQRALTHDEKYAVVKEVYDRVFMAMGIVDVQPELVLDDKRESSVAYLKRNKDGSRTLAVEEKAFDICLGFGDRANDALAFLIGHELGHFRYNHQWGKDFASSFALADIEDKLAEANDKLSELKYFETQADHSGGISCFLAGYDIRGLGEPLLKKVYAEYKLPEETPKYPSLKERILLTQQNDSIVGKLIIVFETGNYAMMIDEYPESIKCFEFVLNKGFKSREVYNNLGVCCLLNAMNLAGKENVKYVYPVEIDVESRINGNAKGFSDDVKGLVEKAKNYFTLATQLDKEYSTGYINLACAHSIAGEIEDGKYAAQKALKLMQKAYADQSNHINAYIILAILYDQEKNPREAKATLEQALKITNSYLAEVNLEIIKGKKASDFKFNKKLAKEKLGNDEAAIQGGFPAETIAGITDLQNDAEALNVKEIEMGKSSCYFVNYKNSVIYNLSTSDGHDLYFQETCNGYEGETVRGRKISDSQNEIIGTYGLPDLAYTTRGSIIFVYKDSHILFNLGSSSPFDPTERVKSWVIWKRY
jgi:tetratricopeptide (TPR) repeat protein